MAAYDDEACPNRGPGLNHTTNGSTHCVECGTPTFNRHDGMGAILQSARRTRDASPVPKAYRPAFYEAVRDGMSPEVAHSTIAADHGLAPTPEQKRPWTLTELAGLEFMRTIAPGLDDTAPAYPLVTVPSQ